MDPRARGWESQEVPLTVAPPPRTGEAAQGPWFADPPSIAAIDHAAMPSDGPATEPAHPQPAATARTVAAGGPSRSLRTPVVGGLLALAALAVAAVVVVTAGGSPAKPAARPP